MADEDRAVMERLAALEAEVKADADAQRARKAAALAKLRDQRVTQTSERDVTRARGGKRGPAFRARAASNPSRRARPARGAGHADELEADPIDVGSALELASKAHRVGKQLARRPRKGEKSWIKSGVASLALGPVGWLYAGSLREAVPATVGWLALCAIALKLLPVFLLMPVLLVVHPLSAIAGVVYALQYNRSGGRQRLFDRDRDDDKPKQLPG